MATLLSGALLFMSGCADRSAGEWKIVFPAARDGDWAIYVVDQKGGAPVRIAALPDPIFGEPPVASPDGRMLILPSPRYQLVVMDTDGTGRKRLASGDPSSAVWSPDGKRIVFQGLSEGLSIIGADGKGGRRLTRGSADAEPAWSPDGKRIAFVQSGTGVMLVDPDGSNLHVLRQLRGDVEQLRWSRDGRSLTFLHHPRPETAFARSDLVTVSVAAGRLLKRVPRVDVEFSRIAWSPDGRHVAYTRYDPLRIVVMDWDGSHRRSIRGGSDPIWSPDGRRIVYLAEEPPGGGQLRSIRPDGTGMRRLTRNYPDGVEPLAPRWLRGRVTPRPSPYRLVVSPRSDGAVLRTHFAVALLAASGSRVALVSPERVWAPSWVSTPPLVLWDVQRRRTAHLALPGCHQPESLAVLDDRVAFDCPSGHAASFGRAIRISATAGARPFEVTGGIVGDGLPPARLPGRVAGGSDLLVFSTYRVGAHDLPPEPELWREDAGGKAIVTRGPDAGEAAAVDRGRIAVERKDGQVALLRRDGRLLGRIAPGGPPPRPVRSPGFAALDRPTVGLSGRDLVVLRAGRLLVYDAASRRPRRSLAVARRAKLAGVSDGLVAYVVGPDIHILRLRDGRSTTIRTRSRSAVEASITSAGLFYALHARPVPPDQVAPFRRNPATVVFLRRHAILQRLGWKHVTVVRRKGSIEATLSYDRHSDGLDEYRRLTLVVRRAGRVVIRDRNDGPVRLGDVRGLSLRNVWGSADPEALVELWTGGNRCCMRVEVGLVDDHDRGRVLVQDFPTYAGGDGKWHGGRFDFVSADGRFDCAFTACAAESQPIRIFALDKAGTRFVDVTRSRPDLVRADAAAHWRWIKRGSYYPVGELAPWCADQDLLGQKERCERLLAELRTYGADGWYGSGGAAAFIRFLHDRLRAWGYG